MKGMTLKCFRTSLCTLGLFVIASLLMYTLYWRPADLPALKTSVFFPLMQDGAADGQNRDIIKVVMVACQTDDPKTDIDSTKRQKLQLLTAVKAAVFLSHRHLRFIIVSDHKDVYDELVKESSTWPPTHRSKVSFQFSPSKYPTKYEHMRTMFRPCSTQRLFLQSLLPKDDAILYMDSDVIFLRPVEEFWSFFDQMDDKQLAAASSYVGGYNSLPQNLRHGNDGFNAGLMLFNLSRIRHFPGGWEDSIASIVQLYKHELVHGDQNILNILFSGNSSYFKLLGCEWNFRSPYYKKKHFRKCSKFQSEGAKVVHGTSGAFFSHEQLQVFFQSWMKMDLSQNVSIFHDKLKEKLSALKGETFQKMADVLSKQLIASNTEI